MDGCRCVHRQKGVWTMYTSAPFIICFQIQAFISRRLLWHTNTSLWEGLPFAMALGETQHVFLIGRANFLKTKPITIHRISYSVRFFHSKPYSSMSLSGIKFEKIIHNVHHVRRNSPAGSPSQLPSIFLSLKWTRKRLQWQNFLYIVKGRYLLFVLNRFLISFEGHKGTKSCVFIIADVHIGGWRCTHRRNRRPF